MGDRSYQERREEEEEEEEDVKDEYDYKAQKDALLLAIEVNESMLRALPASEGDDGKVGKKDEANSKEHLDGPHDSALLAALRCAYKVMQQRIIASPKDMMGILLFGTEKTKGPDDSTGYPHCYVYMPLDVPEASDVKRLKYLVGYKPETKEEPGEEEPEKPKEPEENFEELFKPSTEQVAIKDVFFCANQIFATKAPNFGSRQLFIITDNDDPHSGNKSRNDNAAVRAKDLYDLGVKIKLFPITHDDSTFDITKFYDDVMYRDPEADIGESDDVQDINPKDGLSLLQSLVSTINSKQTPKRAYFSNMPLELGPGFQISVKGYNVIQKQVPARTCYVWVEGEKPQIAIGETSRMADDTARDVEKTEVKKAYKFGGEYVYFSPEELKDVKNFGGPIIRIIGFKDRSLLEFWMSINKSIFIYPSEEGFVGSTRVFSALWQKLLKSKKIGIAWHIARKNGNPQLVALIPSEAQLDKTGQTQVIPPGVWLYPIPFADDVRDPPDASIIRTTNRLTDMMHPILRQLEVSGAQFRPGKYPNPSLQWHYGVLQATALNEELPNDFEDFTLPNYKTIHKRCGEHVEAWSQLADEELAKILQQMAIKREAEAADVDDEPRPAKKPRTAASGAKASGHGVSVPVNDDEVKQAAASGQLSKLKVSDLKSILAVRGVETKGVKVDLVERIERWVGYQEEVEL